MLFRGNFSSIVSINSEANASELLETLEENVVLISRVDHEQRIELNLTSQLPVCIGLNKFPIYTYWSS